MISAHTEIETKIVFKATVGKNLPQYIGSRPQGAPKPGQIIKSDTMFNVRWHQTPDELEYYAFITSTRDQHSIKKLLEGFDAHSSQLVKICEGMGAKSMTAKLKYFPEGEGHPNSVELISWTRHTVLSNFYKSFRAEFWKSGLPSLIVIGGVTFVAIPSGLFQKAIIGFLVSVISTFISGVIKPLFSNRKGFSRD